MLVLKRRTGEGVRIDNDVLVSVLEVNREDGSVRLGFLAPKSRRILREEIWNQEQVEQADEDNQGSD